MKTGVNYFGHEVHMSSDPKIEYLQAECGLAGFGVYNMLLEKIYNNGYWLRWGLRDMRVFAQRNNLFGQIVDSVMTKPPFNELNVDSVTTNALFNAVDVYIVIANVCLNEGLFDKMLYNAYRVLTSRGIQERYFRVVRRRSDIEVVKEFLLVDDDVLKRENVLKKFRIVPLTEIYTYGENESIVMTNESLNSKNVVTMSSRSKHDVDSVTTKGPLNDKNAALKRDLKLKKKKGSSRTSLGNQGDRSDAGFPPDKKTEEPIVESFDEHVKALKFALTALVPIWNERRQAMGLARYSKKLNNDERDCFRDLAVKCEYDPDEFERRLHEYLQRQDEFLVRKKWPVYWFGQKWNELEVAEGGESLYEKFDPKKF